MRTTTRLAGVAAGLFVLMAAGVRAQLPGPPPPVQVDHAPSEVAPRSLEPACPEPQGPEEDPTYTLRAQAFDDIAAGDSTGARLLMRCAIDRAPSDIVALKQEVYLDLDASDNAAAIRDIDRLRELHAAGAELELQEGYIYAGMKKYMPARQAFLRAMKMADLEQRRRATEAIRNLDPSGGARSLEFDLDSQYLQRFDDGIVDFQTRFYQRLGLETPVRVYLNARLLKDTASQVGPLPQIFDDNAFLSGVGLAFQPRDAHYSVTAEANEAYVFYAGANHTAALVPDFRVQAGYYNVFRSEASSRLSLEANGSIGFYSRYQRDGISYLQPQVTYDLYREGNVRMSAYFQGSFAFDTNQQYYNNVAEAIPGIQFTFKQVGGMALKTEYVRGYYLPFHTNSVNPYGSSYNDFRIRLVWYKSLPVGH
jgi:hypothetical protein